MNLNDILNEKIKKVHGKWALVSKSDPDKVLQYYHGKDHPSKEWEKKVERRVHAFSEAESLDKTVDRMRNLDIDDIEHLKRYSNPQLKDWLKRLTAANKNNIGSALNTLDSMGPIAKPFAKSFVQKQFPGVDDTEFDQAWKFWQETDPETRSAVTKGDLTTLDPRDEHGFVTDDVDEGIVKFGKWKPKKKDPAEVGITEPPFAKKLMYKKLAKRYRTLAHDLLLQTPAVDNGEDDMDPREPQIIEYLNKAKFYELLSGDMPGGIGNPEAFLNQMRRDYGDELKEEDDYDAWLEKAKKRAEKQAKKKRAELQQVMKGVTRREQNKDLYNTIHSARKELVKRERETRERMKELEQQYYDLPDEVLDQIIGRYSKGPGAGSDFVEWLHAIKKRKEEDRYGPDRQMDLLRSVAGTIQGNQSQKTAPAADKPWTQLGMTRDEFRKILNNPQHPRHREIKQLQDQYKQVDEDLTRRDFLKGLGAVAAGAALAGPAKAASDAYNKFTSVSPSSLKASPAIDPDRKWNSVGVQQNNNIFRIVLPKNGDPYLYFDVQYEVKGPWAIINFNGGSYHFRSTKLARPDVFVLDRSADNVPEACAILLNYNGRFTVEIDNNTYTFNIKSSPAAQELFKLWKSR